LLTENKAPWLTAKILFSDWAIWETLLYAKWVLHLPIASWADIENETLAKRNPMMIILVLIIVV
jgi:hypothetical protein